VAASSTGATPVFQTTTLTGYDPLGRPTTVTDPRTGTNRTTTTAYTPTPGPLTQTVVTNPLGWTTTTSYNPAWGVPTAVVDQNGHRTDLSYDALGRRTQVWLPDRPKATNPTPSIGYAYTLSTTAPNAVATSTITATGGAATSYALYDGLLRPRQTQAPSEGGGIMLTDTFYDNAGRAARGNDLYFATGTPSATLLIPTLSTPSSSRTVYDGAGRIFAVISLSSGAERWRTGYGYGGDHVDTTPPAGGTPTTIYTDARGNTTPPRRPVPPTKPTTATTTPGG
jgi:YD repeat-containing protein